MIVARIKGLREGVVIMRGEAQFDLPEVALVFGTRAALGIGAGLLIANCMSEEQRTAVGRTLLLIGGAASAALAWELFGKPRAISLSFGAGHNGRESRTNITERISQRSAMAAG
jgi:hypothetical protein